MKLRVMVLSSFLIVASAPAAFAQTSPTPAVLAQQRADVALRILTRLQAQYSAGTATLEELGVWAGRWYQARREAGLTGAPLVAAAQEWVDKMKAIEQLVAARVQSGVSSSVDADKATFYRLEAETALAKARNP
jgi:hypothetical protein